MLSAQIKLLHICSCYYYQPPRMLEPVTMQEPCDSSEATEVWALRGLRVLTTAQISLHLTAWMWGQLCVQVLALSPPNG